MVLLIALGLLFLKHDPTTRRDYWQHLIDYRRISWRWIAVIFLLEPLVTGLSAWLDLRLGGFGPSLAGTVMVYRTKDRAGRQNFWRRTVDFRQIGFGLTMLIVMFFPIMGLIAIALAALVGAPTQNYATLQQVAAQPGLLLVMLLGGLIGGPISEELGWRGFALDLLQDRIKPLTASTILGLLWGAWHLPLFFIPGTTQYGLGINTLDFWLFLLNPIPLSALFAWVYDRTGRSILSAILMHLGFNVTTNLLYPLSPQGMLIHVGLLLIAMAFTLFLGRPLKAAKSDQLYQARYPYSH